MSDTSSQKCVRENAVMTTSERVEYYEPWGVRKARTAADRRQSVEREAQKARLAYIAAGLPVPPHLMAQPELAAPATPPAPRTRLRASKGHGGPNIRSSEARRQAIAAGQHIYQGSPCKRGHSGLRYVAQCDCVECARARNNNKKRAGTWSSFERGDRMKT